MSFISPMLASPRPEGFTIRPGEWVVEEKLDGHRLVMRVQDGSVIAWSRYGRERALPDHVVEAASKLPDGVYDGELLVPGQRSYGVTEIVHSPDLRFVVFDLLELHGAAVCSLTWDERHAFLIEIDLKNLFEDAVQLSRSVAVRSLEQAQILFTTTVSRGGEGVILKRRAAKYLPGKRSKDWIKFKDLRSSVVTITGFEASKGTIQNRGAYATVIVKDDAGHVTSVKTLNDAECRHFEQTATMFANQHPAIGKKLRIEFQERTPHCLAHKDCGGGFRHPRWDRWENE